MNKKIIYLLVGETGAGKDTVANKLCDINNMSKVVSYTTRPIRENETNGVEHYFITKEESDKIKQSNELIAYTKIGEVEYYATVEELLKKDIYIIDPQGVRYFKSKKDILNKYNISIVTIGICLPLEERKNRCMNTRSDYNTAFDKRVESEKWDFIRFRTDIEFDYLIHNKDSNKTANVIKNIIEVETYNQLLKELNTNE